MLLKIPSVESRDGLGQSGSHRATMACHLPLPRPAAKFRVAGGLGQLAFQKLNGLNTALRGSVRVRSRFILSSMKSQTAAPDTENKCRSLSCELASCLALQMALRVPSQVAERRRELMERLNNEHAKVAIFLQRAEELVL